MIYLESVPTNQQFASDSVERLLACCITGGSGVQQTHSLVFEQLHMRQALRLRVQSWDFMSMATV